MLTQTENKGHGFANNTAAQMIVLLVVVAVLIGVTATYLW